MYYLLFIITIVSAAFAETPSWVTRCPDSDGVSVYFVGAADGKFSASTRTGAIRNAITQIATALGGNVTLKQKLLRYDNFLAGESDARFVSSSGLPGLKVEQVFYDDKTTWVLVSVSAIEFQHEQAVRTSKPTSYHKTLYLQGPKAFRITVQEILSPICITTDSISADYRLQYSIDAQCFAVFGEQASYTVVLAVQLSRASNILLTRQFTTLGKGWTKTEAINEALLAMSSTVVNYLGVRLQ
jgi:hypothetical protein